MTNRKNYKMIILWIAVILVGTALTIWGSLKLNDAWTKADELKKQHPIPDFLLFDCELEIKFNERTTREIMDKVYGKSVMIGGDVRTIPNMLLTPFFNEYLYSKDENARINYSLNPDFYAPIKSIQIIGQSKSKDAETQISFKTNNNEILLGSEIAENMSYITVQSFNIATRTFKLKLNNIQLDVSLQTASKYILDLSTIDFHFINSPEITITKISNCFLKTKTTKYFKLKDITVHTLDRYHAVLVPVIYL